MTDIYDQHNAASSRECQISQREGEVTMKVKATYSPEDNKIRLYPSERLDAEAYEKVKAHGFLWAPKQGLFVAPRWSPKREDLAISLAGELEPEHMTIAERAQIKAERLDALAAKRLQESNAFQRAARDVSERFANGQPILSGHHSARKAEKESERAKALAVKAEKAHDLAGYWLYRATGVEAHANHKNDPRVRAGRIKALLVQLRDIQRDINHANMCLRLWDKITKDALIIKALGSHLKTGPLSPYDLWSDVNSGKISPQDARLRCVELATRAASSRHLQRWIEHILNRLSYERELLGPVTRYHGKITPVILQAFAREHGALSPEGKSIDGETFVLQSPVALPLHLGSGNSLEMAADEWRDLMHAVGYEVPAPKPGLPPILNFKAEYIIAASPHRRGEVIEFRQVEMTSEAYGKTASGWRGTSLSLCGGFRFRTCPDPYHEGPRYTAKRVAVFLADSKAHPTPDSPALNRASVDA